MTREQARREIDDIDYYLQHHTDDYSESSHTAMMMAISALEQNEKAAEWYKLFVKKLDEQEPCDDAISRKALIDKIYYGDDGEKAWFGTPETDEKVIEMIKSMPSVQLGCRYQRLARYER